MRIKFKLSRLLDFLNTNFDVTTANWLRNIFVNLYFSEKNL